MAHKRFPNVAGVQTCALPIYHGGPFLASEQGPDRSPECRRPFRSNGRVPESLLFAFPGSWSVTKADRPFPFPTSILRSCASAPCFVNFGLTILSRPRPIPVLRRLACPGRETLGPEK